MSRRSRRPNSLAAALVFALVFAPIARAVGAVEQDPIKELNSEDLRLLHLAVGDLAASPQGQPDHGVPTAYPNDVVHYITRYRAAAAPFLLSELAQAKDDRTAGWILLLHRAGADRQGRRAALSRRHRSRA